MNKELKPKLTPPSSYMSTKEVMAETGLPRSTILRFVVELDAIPVGGSKGYIFPKKAPQWLRAQLRKTRGGAQWRKMRKPENANEGNI